VLLDGAHTWPHDALAFLLVERLLNRGGFVHLDDCDWSLSTSPTMRPDVFPATSRQWTEEQIREQHVRLIAELLVQRDNRWREIEGVPGNSRIFEKTKPIP
jgi:hypothetical protein